MEDGAGAEGRRRGREQRGGGRGGGKVRVAAAMWHRGKGKGRKWRERLRGLERQRFYPKQAKNKRQGEAAEEGKQGTSGERLGEIASGPHVPGRRASADP